MKAKYRTECYFCGIPIERGEEFSTVYARNWNTTWHSKCLHEDSLEYDDRWTEREKSTARWDYEKSFLGNASVFVYTWGDLDY